MTTTSNAPTERGPSAPASARRPFDYAAWLIDLDGTLYHQRPVQLMMGLELAAFRPAAIKVLKEVRREHERLHHEELSANSNPFDLQIQRSAERCGVAVEEVSRLVDEWMLSRPGKWLKRFRRRWLLEQIRLFRAQGGKTGLVSDYPAVRKLAAIGIGEMFDVVIAAGEPGGQHQLKPSPAGFLLAARQLQVRPQDCLVIGDRWDADGEAAHRADMQFQHIASHWPA